MNRRLLVSCLAVGLFAGFIDTPTASAQQSINFFVGGFVPRSFDARGTIDDVLFENDGFLLFDMKDFRGATAGAEYLVHSAISSTRVWVSGSIRGRRRRSMPTSRIPTAPRSSRT